MEGREERQGGAASSEDQESWAVPLGFSEKGVWGVAPRAVP